LILATQAAAIAAPIRTLPDLLTVTVYEVTFGTVAVPFAANAPELTQRISVLTDAERDFSFFSLENYDVFYSNADGTLNADGAFLTIEGVWQAGAPFGGGSGNIAEVELAFGGVTPHTQFGDFVASYAFGSICDAGTCIPDSVPRSVDGNLGSFPRMGHTDPLDPDDRFRLTIGFEGISEVEPIPEPSAWMLVAAGLVGFVVLARRRAPKRP
jgi:hypothetical protein